MRSSAEAKAFLTELKLLLTYLGVSDCNMQEGSLRVDANVNLHIDTPQGTVATPIVEIKNMNSFRAVERALDYEAQRQWREWQETQQRLGDAPKQTRGWDDAAGVTRGQRSKEESSDYRYFPDPDLVPVTVAAGRSRRDSRQSLGELPAALATAVGNRIRAVGLRRRRAGEPGPAGRRLLSGRCRAARRRQGGGQLGHARCAANAQGARYRQSTRCRSRSAALADLITKIKAGEIPSPRAREVFPGHGGTSASMPQRR